MTKTSRQYTEGDQSPNVSAGGDVNIHYGSSDGLLQSILTYFPQYLADFGSVFSGPKKFIARRNTKAAETFRDSLLFLGFSVVASVLATWPLLPKGADIRIYLAANAVSVVLAVLLFSVILRLAWRIVGGTSEVKSFFVTYSYFGGVSMIVIKFFQLLGEGVFKVLDNTSYLQVIEAQRNQQPLPDLSDNPVYLTAFGITIAGCLVMACWGIVAWGAYRDLNGSNKWRSFGAFLLFSLLSLPAFAFVFFVSAALSSTSAPAS